MPAVQTELPHPQRAEKRRSPQSRLKMAGIADGGRPEAPFVENCEIARQQSADIDM